MDHIQLVVGDFNVGWLVQVLSHDICLFQTDGESKVTVTFVKVGHELLEASS